jgi:MoaA/NifB/PqqE/SkfB family radical SAM enzyme
MAPLEKLKQTLFNPSRALDAVLRRKIAFDIARGVRNGKTAFRGPVDIMVSVSNRCNYGCIMCTYHPRFVEPDNPFIDEAERVYHMENPGVDRSCALMELKTFDRLASDAAAMGTQSISLFGLGEPLLNPNLPDMIDAVKTRGMICNLSTNGSLLDRDRIDKFIQLGLDEINISLNAATDETYNKIHGKSGENNLNRITELIAYACEEKKRRGAKLPLGSLSFVILNMNHNEAADMARIAVRSNVDQVYFSNIFPYDGTSFLQMNNEQKLQFDGIMDIIKNELDRHHINHKIEILQESAAREIDPRYPTRDYYREFPCYMGWFYAAVMADGTVNACNQCYINMGNVNDSSFKEIWNSPKYEDFRNRTKSLPRLGGKLPECLCDNCCFVNRNAYTREMLAPYRKYLSL